jgi:hypothetical protein
MEKIDIFELGDLSDDQDFSDNMVKISEFADEFTNENQDLIDNYYDIVDEIKDRFFAYLQDNDIEITDDVSEYFYNVFLRNII